MKPKEEKSMNYLIDRIEMRVLYDGDWFLRMIRKLFLSKNFPTGKWSAIRTALIFHKKG